ncbi:phosphate acyltransferase PlsX [Endozoicomonas sp. 8E]|uniref:phosphate acyltransferase PlsX n=1 Tax=Endozoicomonas sp. 8E TaxID=3035692 RepID=UPI002938D319|nr:phosphate acyltransferase PlsX [Endozoicomonas sp. 8E]WOG25767.1 phosphate acyltransferase PlsX [Endozoicomonas sp. 8E]
MTSGANEDSKITVALDVMSGDDSPRSRIRAAVRSLEHYSSLHLLLVGDRQLMEDYLSDIDFSDQSRYALVHANKTVAMHERPSLALRGKKDSSMWKVLELVSKGEAQACVSAGNTGALMAMGRYVLKTFAGIDRPAIAASVPTSNGSALLMDMGANVDCTSMHLYQFAIMGAQLASSVYGVESPKVALLNIGTEEMKGNEQVRLAHHLLLEKLELQQGLDYIGFVEGHDIFSGRADVIVCDGFVGNVALKTGEGVANLVRDGLRAIFQRSLLNRFLYFFISPLLEEFNRKVDPVLHNGASLLGLQGVVIKSHGGADEEGFYRAILQAVKEAQNDVPAKIAREVEERLL